MEQRTETIFTLELPYRETLLIQRRIYRGGRGPRTAIVAGFHGDAAEGLYICHQLVAWLADLACRQPQALRGQVEFYPTLNPLNLIELQRLATDFAGPAAPLPEVSADAPAQRIAAALLHHLAGTEMTLTLHPGALCETLQVRLERRFAETLLPLAQWLNVDAIWLQQTTPAHVTTLAHHLNQRGAVCLPIITGRGLRRALTDQLVPGIINLWRRIGVLAPDFDLPIATPTPLLVDDDTVYQLHANMAGLFAPATVPGTVVVEGALIGSVVAPLTTRAASELRAPVGGKILSLRRNPWVFEGALVTRIAATPPME